MTATKEQIKSETVEDSPVQHVVSLPDCKCGEAAMLQEDEGGFWIECTVCEKGTFLKKETMLDAVINWSKLLSEN